MTAGKGESDDDECFSYSTNAPAINTANEGYFGYNLVATQSQLMEQELVCRNASGLVQFWRENLSHFDCDELRHSD